MAKKVLLKRYNHKKLGWLHDSVFFVIAVFVIFILFRFVIGFSYVSGDSMEPNLHDGEAVLYLRTVSNYKVGDVVSVWVPSGDYYVKRIVATGGDCIEIRNNQVYINDEKFNDVYGVGKTMREEGSVIYPYVVRDGNYFVLGDNREVSMDSRGFGEVNKIQIKGKILLRFGKGYVKGVNE